MVGRTLKQIVAGLACLGLIGCGGGGGSSSSSSGASPNIYGLVSSTNGSFSLGFSKMRVFAKSLGFSTLGLSGIPNCTITAYSLDDNSVVATGTSDSSGEYTLTGVASGTTYKIVADCGSGNILTSVATADSQDKASKDPVETSPMSTVIAALIIKAIVSAVDDALAGLPGGVPDAVKIAVKQAIFDQLQVLMTSIQTTVTEAIASGSMTEPDITSANAVGGELVNKGYVGDGADYDAVLSGYTGSGNDIPSSVSGAVDGAKSTASALPACDSTLNTGSVTVASPALCTRAVTKLMFNALHFSVGLKKSSGVFATEVAGGCSSANASLEAIFANADYLDGDADPMDEIPGGFCFVVSKLGIPDRNRGMDQGSGDHDRPVFTEDGDLDGDSNSDTGVLTAIGTTMYVGRKYHLSDIDKLVFSYDAGSESGMNSRAIAKVVDPNTKLSSFYFLNASGLWVNTPWVNTCDQNHDGTSAEACEFWNLNFGFTLPVWGSAAKNLTVAEAIGAGNDLTLEVFKKKFGGPVPSMGELDAFIDGGRIHIENNPTGEKEFYVLYKEEPDYGQNGGSNGCGDNNPSTPCLGKSGTAYPALRLNIALGTKDADGVTPIVTISESVSGKFWVRPFFNQNGFSRVFQFISVADGRLMRDELLRERGVMAITDAVSQCVGALTVASASCQQGRMYNVSIDWSTCNGGPDNCPSVSVSDIHPIKKDDGSLMNVNLKADYNTNWYQYFSSGNSTGGHPLLASNNGYTQDPIKVQINGSDVITSVDIGRASSASEYNIAIHWDCTSNCTPDGFYLVDKDGVPYQRVGAGSTWPAGSIWSTGMSGMVSVANGNVVKYYDGNTGGVNYDLSAVNLDWDLNRSSSQSFADAMRRYRLDSGPVPNPHHTCSQEPFYIDISGNGKLDCNVSDNAAVDDVSFSSYSEYAWWVIDPAHASEHRDQYTLQKNDNGFAFGDPIGTKTLLTTAFSGWFDGAHSITSTTDLNSIQVFGLVYLFFTEGSDGNRHIEGISGLPAGASNDFMVEGPMMGSNGNKLKALNKSIGNAIINFHQ